MVRNILSSRIAKVLLVASVVFVVQQSYTPETKSQDELHKASLSCQNWSQQGYADLMKCD